MHASAPLPDAPPDPGLRLGPPSPLLLAGDVGGTKTVLALAEAGSGRIIAEQSFPSRDHATFESVAAAFRARHGAPVQRCVLSVAGPVVGGRARITNLPWTVDASALRGALRAAEVRLVNDLQATALAVPYLLPHQLRTVHAGTADPAGVRAVVAVGTGLGEAMLVPGPAGFTALASEGGHADFGPRGATQRALLASLAREQGHVGYERVCSGLAIPGLYRFLAARARVPAPLADGPDPTPAIVEAGLAPGGCPVCRRTVRLLARILGAEAGNVALRTLATGGVYLGGGIPPRILPALRGRGFREAFHRTGPLGELLSAIPVHVILEPRAALLGAARWAAAA